MYITVILVVHCSIVVIYSAIFDVSVIFHMRGIKGLELVFN